MSTPSDDPLVAVVRARTVGRRSILGAQLGAIIRADQPGLDIKADFGGLKQFVAARLAGLLRPVGKSGLDDVYEFVGQDPPEAAYWRPASPHERIFWQVFSNPTATGKLAYQPEMRLLQVSQSIDAPMEDRKAVETMSKEDYREAARAWLDGYEGLDEGGRQRLRDILTLGDFWSSWYQAVVRHADPALRHSWEDARRAAIRTAAETAFAAAGLPEEEIGRWSNILFESKSAKPTSRPYMPSAAAASAVLMPGVRQRDVRHLALAAVRQLSDGELRRLRLPLGAVWDALLEGE